MKSYFMLSVIMQTSSCDESTPIKLLYEDEEKPKMVISALKKEFLKEHEDEGFKIMQDNPSRFNVVGNDNTHIKEFDIWVNEKPFVKESVGETLDFIKSKVGYFANGYYHI